MATIEARWKATTSTRPSPAIAPPRTMALVKAHTNHAYWKRGPEFPYAPTA
jgi:hypothetical protein